MTSPSKYMILHLLRIHIRHYDKRKIWWMWHHMAEKGKKSSSGDRRKPEILEKCLLLLHFSSPYSSAGWWQPKWTVLAQCHNSEESLIVGGMLKTLGLIPHSVRTALGWMEAWVSLGWLWIWDSVLQTCGFNPQHWHGMLQWPHGCQMPTIRELPPSQIALATSFSHNTRDKEVPEYLYTGETPSWG